MSTDGWQSAMNAAAVCEVFWQPAGGPVRAMAATPLLWNQRPTLALPFAQAATARGIATADSVSIVLSDPRLAGNAWRPLVVTGRPELIEDTSGDLFSGTLLMQELRKHPPSRTLADSPLLRREHWWFVLRLLISIEPAEFAKPARREGGGTDAVLAGFGKGIQVATVRAPHATTGSTRLTGLSDAALPAAGPAVLLQHDFSVPDRERECAKITTGEWDGESLRVAAQRGDTRLPGPLGLVARMRRQFRLSRECRKGLADIG